MRLALNCIILFLSHCCFSQHARAQGASVRWASALDSLPRQANTWAHPQLRSFAATASMLDAALTSLNSLRTVISKDNYRNRVTALNNPASSELGFSLEGEVQAALQPILAKTRTVNTTRFTDIAGALLRVAPQGSALPVVPALTALVANLAVQEKRVSREDVDTFLQRTGRYFAPYEKLNKANEAFEQQVVRLNSRLVELQFDIREYTLDIVILLHPREQRSVLRQKTIEDLLLQFLDGPVLDSLDGLRDLPAYPSDAVKGAKDICNNVQKLFREYQKIYGDNYNEIRSIVQSARGLARSGSSAASESALRELEALYTESAQADALNLRLSALTGRLQALVLSTTVST
ncbi:MAG: hypothetical protein EOP50_08685, partial [Sphingobacteriales bacterium]